MAITTFKGPVHSTNGFVGSLTLPDALTVTTLDASGTITGVAADFTGAVTALSLNPGSSSVALSKIIKGTVAVNPAVIAANTQAETAVTITGAATGDVVIMNPPASLEAGLVYSHARVSAADTVRVGLGNITGSPVDGASLTWTYLILRFA